MAFLCVVCMFSVCSCGFSQGDPGFLPQSKNMYDTMLTGECELCVNICGCLFICGPAIDWWPLQDVLQPSVWRLIKNVSKHWFREWDNRILLCNEMFKLSNASSLVAIIHKLSVWRFDVTFMPREAYRRCFFFSATHTIMFASTSPRHAAPTLRGLPCVMLFARFEAVISYYFAHPVRLQATVVDGTSLTISFCCTATTCCRSSCRVALL